MSTETKPSSPELAIQEAAERLKHRQDEFADIHLMTLQEAMEEVAPIFFAAATPTEGEGR